MEHFGTYSEITWHAAAAGGFYREADKLPIIADIENFKLERFVDLRKQVGAKPRSFKLMLMDLRSKTNILIDGPDPRIDEIVERLPYYKDKLWPEIQKMRLERDSLSCRNAFSALCDPWMLDNMLLEPVKPGQPASELDLIKADKICASCKNYEYGEGSL